MKYKTGFIDYFDWVLFINEYLRVRLNSSGIESHLLIEVDGKKKTNQYRIVRCERCGYWRLITEVEWETRSGQSHFQPFYQRLNREENHINFSSTAPIDCNQEIPSPAHYLITLVEIVLYQLIHFEKDQVNASAVYPSSSIISNFFWVDWYYGGNDQVTWSTIIIRSFYRAVY